MMPVFGERSRFAIEFDLDDEHHGAWMYGRFCYWCDGLRVGDYELSTSLRDVLFQLDEQAKYRQRRGNRRFSVMPAEAVFRLLDGAVWRRGS